VTGRAEQDPEHDLALGDEVTRTTDEVALANVAVLRDPRVLGIVHGDDVGHDASMHSGFWPRR
jgi:hypothetical protein